MTDLRNKMEQLAGQIADKLLAEEVPLQDQMAGLKILCDYYGKSGSREDDRPKPNGWSDLRERIGGKADAEAAESEAG